MKSSSSDDDTVRVLRSFLIVFLTLSLSLAGWMRWEKKRTVEKKKKIRTNKRLPSTHYHCFFSITVRASAIPPTTFFSLLSLHKPENYLVVSFRSCKNGKPKEKHHHSIHTQVSFISFSHFSHFSRSRHTLSLEEYRRVKLQKV